MTFLNTDKGARAKIVAQRYENGKLIEQFDLVYTTNPFRLRAELRAAAELDERLNDLDVQYYYSSPPYLGFFLSAEDYENSWRLTKVR